MRDRKYLTIYELLRARAEHAPEAVAIVAPGRRALNYGELLVQVGEVVRALNVRGVQPGDRVAIVLPNGPEMAVAFLGVAAAASCAPLNPAYSRSEFEFYLADLNPKALIVQSGMNVAAVAVAEERGIPIIELVPKPEAAAGMFDLRDNELPLTTDVDLPQANDIALVLHTSGTTSRPKMVPLTHANLLASAGNIAATLRLSEADLCLNVMPLFHIHGLVGALLSSLMAGGSVVCTAGFEIEQFFSWIEAFRPTWYTAVPTIHHAVLSRAQADPTARKSHSLRFIRSSSAALPARVMQGLEETFKVPVIESYGMTEAAHQMASNPLPPGQRKIGSVGLAAGPEVSIMDEVRQFLTSGEIGEIVIRGANVTSGYGNSEANAEAFTRGWFRTGDQGYLDKDGYLFITGRLKEIINRGGEKIAPREVDDVILQHPAVAEAICFAMPHPTLGEDIAAAVVLRQEVAATELEIQQFVASRLADFKVPRQIILLNAIPKAATGKIQRIGLAEKLGFVDSHQELNTRRIIDITPGTQTENALTRIWSAVLGLDVGLDDNFLHLGGNSIHTAQIISRVRESLGAELSFAEFFESPTVAAMARAIEKTSRKSRLVKALTFPEDGIGPLSFTQEALWFLDQLDPGNPAYNRPVFASLQGNLKPSILEKCISEIVRRHSSLRTRFPAEDGKPVQHVYATERFSLPVTDISSLPVPGRESQLRKLAAEEARKPFDLAQGPTFRLKLVRVEERLHIILATAHHIVIDGWSAEIFIRELQTLYDAFSAGRASPLLDLPSQYLAYARWQRDAANDELMRAYVDYWKRQLNPSIPPLNLITDRTRPLIQTFNGAKRFFTLSKELLDGLKAISRREESTLFMTLLSAFKVLLHHYSRQHDIIVGTPFAGRNQVHTEDMIGNFTTTLPLHTNLSSNPSFRELLARVRKTVQEAHAHQIIPFEKIAPQLHLKRDNSRPPVYQVLFQLRNYPRDSRQSGELRIEKYERESATSAFDMSLSISEDRNGLEYDIVYNTELFDDSSIARMAAQYSNLVKNIVANPDQKLSDFPWLAETKHRTSELPELTNAEADPPLAEENSIKADHATELCKQELSDVQMDKSSANARTVIPRRQDGQTMALSFAQQRLWFLSKLDPQSPAYNQPKAIRLQGTLQIETLKKSLETIIERHEVLRTTYCAIDGQPSPVVSQNVPIEVPIIDISGYAEPEREARLQSRIAEITEQPFDLSRDLTLRAALLKLGAAEFVLLLVTHHIASDGWSNEVLRRELTTLYEAFVSGKPNPLPELPIQYADYAVWQREWVTDKVLEKQLSYWKTQLSNIPTLELHTDRSRRAIQTSSGARQTVVFPRVLSDQLKDLSRNQGVTLFMTLLAAFQTLLCRYTGQDDIAVGSPIAGRTRVELENLIGVFVNTLVLRADLSGNPIFRELLAQVRRVALEAYQHHDVPFEKVVEVINPERDLSHTPLFKVNFAFQNIPRQTLDLAALVISPIEIEREPAKFDLTLYAWEEEHGLKFSLVYNTDIFDASTITRMLGHFETLLKGIVSDADKRISDLPILTEEERHQLVVECDEPQREYPNACIQELFERQVGKTPDAVALVFEDRQLTYRELNARANQVAHCLRRRGVGPETLIAICAERSLEVVIGLVGILKAGAAYLPLDPTYPAERIAFMLDDSIVPVLLTQTSISTGPLSFVVNGSSTRETICLDSDWKMIAQESTENPTRNVGPENLAYVIYTSGSTGKPKGVMVTHANLVRLFSVTKPWFAFNDRDVWTLFHSYAFDFSVWEMWGALSTGGRLVVVPYWVSRSPEAFWELSKKENVTVLNQTPSAFRQLMPFAIGNVRAEALSLRWIIFGGEALDLQSLRAWMDCYGDHNPQLVNMYGITETTVHVTYRPLTLADTHSSSGSLIGRPIADLQLYILDENRQLVPIGVPGEVYIAGAGVARGYLNRPELTDERFILHSFDEQQKAVRLYKSGDRARRLSNGDFEYLGRVDNQVKIRGFRIEVGEIEAVLNQHPAVREVAVVARENRAGENQLVAYIVLRQQVTTTVSDLRSFMKAKLPDYMTPAAFVLLDLIPLTPNGKVDRRALPEPDPGRPELEQAFVAPQNDFENSIATVWRDALHLDKVGIHDNFFDLGGHSLLLVQLHSHVQKLVGRDLSLIEMFEHPTVSFLG